jgi:hypothetical protein
MRSCGSLMSLATASASSVSSDATTWGEPRRLNNRRSRGVTVVITSLTSATSNDAARALTRRSAASSATSAAIGSITGNIAMRLMCGTGPLLANSITCVPLVSTRQVCRCQA